MAARGGGSRIGLSVGLGVAGGIGYYLYQAGGDPKLAEREFERTSHPSVLRLVTPADTRQMMPRACLPRSRATSPGRKRKRRPAQRCWVRRQARRSIRRSVVTTGGLRQSVDFSQIAEAKATTSKIDEKLEAYRAQADKKIGEVSSQTAKELHSAVDKFDKTVEDKTAQSKSWLSGWFK